MHPAPPVHPRSLSPSSSLSSSPSSSRSPARAASRWIEGWSLTITTGAAVASLAAAIAIAGGGGAEALGLAIRLTARTSFALFLAAFTASATHRLWPGHFTRWQRRNRRYLGVAFAVSHVTHAAAIVALASLHPAAFHERAASMSRIPGLVAYGLLVAMAVTSFDRTAAWVGARAWKVLHTVGGLYLWGAFVNAFLIRALHAPAYWVAVAVAAAAMGLRVAAWRRGRRTRPALVAAR